MTALRIVSFPGPDVRAPDHPDPALQEGKFLQIVWRGCEYLLFAPRARHRYHNQLLAEFLRDNGLPHHWPTAEQLTIDTPNLTVRGGGRYRVDWARGTLRLWDDSQAYGRFDAKGLVERLHTAASPWAALTVHIE